MGTLLINGLIYTGKEILTGKSLLIENDRITAIITDQDVPADVVRVDCKGSIIAPGFIDLQIYGGGGYLFSGNLTASALHEIADFLVSKGTIGFLITLATNSIEVFLEAIRLVRDNPHPAVWGLHLEGPYLNPLKRGAHIEEFIKRPQKEEIELLLNEAKGVIKMMTLAPEMTDPGIIKLLNENGVIVSAGHSNATYKEATAGFQQGIGCATHLFNAMSPFHHRDTGLPGAVFQSENVHASIVADGIHVDFQTLSVSKKLLGERLYFITDAMEQSHKGPYIHIEQSDRFTLPNGTLSGSKLTMLKAVENGIKYAGISLDEALRMATLYPAKVFGNRDTGVLEVQAKANIVVFNAEFEIEQVWLNGERRK